ncbi:MAG: amino acid permease [Sorangiineae bacterium]|nr:amino acid permease [Polyangiaceae bacterium]MEB2323094.1 amino acid permease [Sorangiineae bacterium]
MQSGEEAVAPKHAEAAPASATGRRSIGLGGATTVGIGATIGGGILVLAGPAFAATGPSSLVAFALDGVLAGLAALSFAEMSAAFPESGGAYTFAKKVLSVRAAFAVGWVVWFAYIVAGALYALGFAAYAADAIASLVVALGGSAPEWLTAHRTVIGFSLLATTAYTLSLIRKASGGGRWMTVGKMLVFAVLIVAGAWALPGAPAGTISTRLTPFVVHGATGLLSAMGLAFISFQGFHLVAAIAGEVKQPERVIPRSMLASLGAAVAVYLPLLFLVATVGVKPGGSITAMSETRPDTVVADAVGNYLGPAGYWLVAIAAILSTLSALHANLLAASRVALAMARDRTLPRVLAKAHATRRTPVMALYASGLALAGILLMVPSVTAAGAAASLIFLFTFALAHATSILARLRARTPSPFRTPWFPLVPLVGGLASGGMAIFQAFAVPAAGMITAVWLGLGVLLYYAIFADRAEVVDAMAEAQDPTLTRLRGRSPLVLVPIANPASAPALVSVASALAPKSVGRVMLLAVMRPEQSDGVSAPRSLVRIQDVLREALIASLKTGHHPEALMTIAPAPWSEIARVVRTHRCESLLVGLSNLDEGDGARHLEALLNDVDCDVAVLRAPPGWSLATARRIVVPAGGRGGHDELRARLLGSLCRGAEREVTFVRTIPPGASRAERAGFERELRRLAEDETPGKPRIELIEGADVAGALAVRARDADLLIMGVMLEAGRRLFGSVALGIARDAPCATIMISRRG